jgi:N4-gp56 family major capsid protein
MVVGVTTYSDIGQRTTAWAAAEMLSHAEPVLILSKFGLPKPMPMNKANVVKFRRPIPFAVSTTPLVEGVTPTAHKMQYEDVSATMAQYGDSVQITDVVADLAEDPVLKDATMLTGEQAAATIEAVIWAVIKAGTNVYYTNGTARTSVNTVISLTKQRKVTAYLNRMKAKQITKVLSGSVNFDTTPIEAAYIAVGHTDLASDIRNMPGFVPVAKYGSRQPIVPQEIGCVEDVRYILSADLGPFLDGGGAKAGADGTTMSTSGTSADVYPVVYIGQEAYGLVPLKGEQAITPMVVNMKASASDPLAQRGYVSWKTYFTAVRLNETWMCRLECAVLAL